jgi:hypothetical protein
MADLVVERKWAPGLGLIGMALYKVPLEDDPKTIERAYFETTVTVKVPPETKAMDVEVVSLEMGFGKLSAATPSNLAKVRYLVAPYYDGSGDLILDDGIAKFDFRAVLQDAAHSDDTGPWAFSVVLLVKCLG